MTAQSPVAAKVFASESAASSGVWDRFAQRCGASFRCAHSAGAAWQFESHWAFRLRRLDVFQETPAGPKKVGQCAVGVGRRLRIFADGLQVPPEFKTLWPLAMEAVLRKLGPGQYQYGSEWSVEPPRDHALVRLDGVTVDTVSPTQVDVIDLSRWAGFEDYRMSASSNVRRNVRKAEKSYPALRIVDSDGMMRADQFVHSVRLRQSLFRRKGIHRSAVGMAVRSLARLLALRKYNHTAMLFDGRELLASYTGVRFGRQFSYLEGASGDDTRGASWYLLMAMIERAFQESDGNGLFVMGSDDGTQAGDPAWEGLRRSRRQACATSVPTAVVQFRYARVPVRESSTPAKPTRAKTAKDLARACVAAATTVATVADAATT